MLGSFLGFALILFQCDMESKLRKIPAWSGKYEWWCGHAYSDEARNGLVEVVSNLLVTGGWLLDEAV
jgi:hypothetical protein